MHGRTFRHQPEHGPFALAEEGTPFGCRGVDRPTLGLREERHDLLECEYDSALVCLPDGRRQIVHRARPDQESDRPLDGAAQEQITVFLVRDDDDPRSGSSRPDSRDEPCGADRSVDQQYVGAYMLEALLIQVSIGLNPNDLNIRLLS